MKLFFVFVSYGTIEVDAEQMSQSSAVENLRSLVDVAASFVFGDSGKKNELDGRLSRPWLFLGDGCDMLEIGQHHHIVQSADVQGLFHPFPFNDDGFGILVWPLVDKTTVHHVGNIASNYPVDDILNLEKAEQLKDDVGSSCTGRDNVFALTMGDD